MNSINKAVNAFRLKPGNLDCLVFRAGKLKKIFLNFVITH